MFSRSESVLTLKMYREKIVDGDENKRNLMSEKNERAGELSWRMNKISGVLWCNKKRELLSLLSLH